MANPNVDAGTLQGQTVTWMTRNVSNEKAQAVLESPYQQNQVIQDLGPRARRVALKFFLQQPAMDAKARTIADLLAGTGLHVVTDRTAVFYEDQHAFVRVAKHPFDRQQLLTQCTMDVAYVGNNRSHRLGLLATVKQLANVWGLAGKTALRVPVGCSLEVESLTDATRRVIRTPAAFTSFDASYTPGGGKVLRNAGALVRLHASDPSLLFTAIVQAIVNGANVYGVGYDLTQQTLRNVAVDVLLDAAGGKLTFTDRLAGQPAYSLTGHTFGRAAHGAASLPATPARHVVLLDNDATLKVQSNGNVLFQPGGAAFKAAGGATRSLGGSVYWYSPVANTYLVATVDFAVAADGTIGYGVVTTSGNLLTNGSFNPYGTPTSVPSSWASLGGTGVAFAKEVSNVHSPQSTVAVKVTAGSGTTNQGLKQTLAGLSVGALTYVEAFGTTAGGGSEQATLQLWNVTDAVEVAHADGTAGATAWERLFVSFTPVAAKTYELRLKQHENSATGRVAYFADASVKTYLSQAATGDPDAVFGVVFTTDTGTNRDNRLRECLVDHFTEWVPEAR